MRTPAALGPIAAVPLGERTRRLLLRELLAPGCFVLAVLLSNYALWSMPNVKLFDVLVFAAGYTLGLRRGATVAVAAWLVWGSFNPWGYASASLLVTLMASEVVYAAAGAAVRLQLGRAPLRLVAARSAGVFVAAALVATALYDVATNVYTGVFWAGLAGGTDYSGWVRTALFNPGALYFMAVHMGSNAVLFPLAGPVLLRGTEHAKDVLGWR